MKKLLETKRNRSGYGDRETLYKETDLIDFLECSDPYEYLSSYNKVSICDWNICIVRDWWQIKRDLQDVPPNRRHASPMWWYQGFRQKRAS